MTILREEFLHLARLDQATLDVWIDEQWLRPAEPATELAFSDADLARANLIRDLKEVFEVNDEGVGVILDLLDQVHSLRRTLAGVLQAIRERAALPDPGAATGEDGR